jgi:hypothetical protein
MESAVKQQDYENEIFLMTYNEELGKKVETKGNKGGKGHNEGKKIEPGI